MQAFSKFNRGFKYLLAVIDIFSKYGWLIPLKDKTGKSVASALYPLDKEKFQKGYILNIRSEINTANLSGQYKY